MDGFRDYNTVALVLPWISERQRDGCRLWQSGDWCLRFLV